MTTLKDCSCEHGRDCFKHKVGLWEETNRVRLDLKCHMGWDFSHCPLRAQAQDSIAIGMKWHCRKLVVSFVSGGSRFSSPILPLFNSFCKCLIEHILHMPHCLVDRTLHVPRE